MHETAVVSSFVIFVRHASQAPPCPLLVCCWGLFLGSFYEYLLKVWVQGGKTPTVKRYRYTRRTPPRTPGLASLGVFTFKGKSTKAQRDFSQRTVPQPCMTSSPVQRLSRSRTRLVQPRASSQPWLDMFRPGLLHHVSLKLDALLCWHSAACSPVSRKINPRRHCGGQS